jgi:hypothetical protein
LGGGPLTAASSRASSAAAAMASIRAAACSAASAAVAFLKKPVIGCWARALAPARRPGGAGVTAGGHLMRSGSPDAGEVVLLVPGFYSFWSPVDQKRSGDGEAKYFCGTHKKIHWPPRIDSKAFWPAGTKAM